MVLDNALQRLDELKDKYMREIDKAIDDWDYQDFSADKRIPLLDHEVRSYVEDDMDSTPPADSPPKEGVPINWAGLTREAQLVDEDCGNMVASNISLPYEARVVILATPAGGVQGLPDQISVQSFIAKAAGMKEELVVEAWYARLQQTTWQIRCKTLALMEYVLENKELVGNYLDALRRAPHVVRYVDKIRLNDPNQLTRENARKVLSLIYSEGSDIMYVHREHQSPRKTNRAHAKIRPKPTRLNEVAQVDAQRVKPNPVVSPGDSKENYYQAISPKVAAAALASWRRRSQRDMLDLRSPSSKSLMHAEQVVGSSVAAEVYPLDTVPVHRTLSATNRRIVMREGSPISVRSVSDRGIIRQISKPVLSSGPANSMSTRGISWHDGKSADLERSVSDRGIIRRSSRTGSASNVSSLSPPIVQARSNRKLVFA